MALELKMLRIWTIFFSCGWLVSAQGTDAPGAILKLALGTIEHAVSDAMTESNILQKLAADASEKQPGVKPIKGISGIEVKDVQPPEITLTFLPATGLFLAVLTNVTIAGDSFRGGRMEITVVSNMTARNELLQDDSGYPKFSAGDCQISLVSVKTNLPNSMLPELVNKFLNFTLQKALPGLELLVKGFLVSVIHAAYVPAINGSGSEALTNARKEDMEHGFANAFQPFPVLNLPCAGLPPPPHFCNMELKYAMDLQTNWF